MTETMRIDSDTVRATCSSCGSTERIEMTQVQEDAWRQGALIQNVLPWCPPDQREMLISGFCGECFEGMFPNDVDADDEPF